MKNLFLSLIFFVGTSETSQTLSTGAAINIAGKQTTIPQRTGGAYPVIGAAVNIEDASRKLDESSSFFNETLRKLETFSENKETTGATNFTAVLLAKLRRNLSATPTIENSKKIIADANNLTTACNIVSERIVSTSGAQSATLTNICDTQRLFIQKITVYYMPLFWEVSYKNLTKEINDATTNYEIGLTALSNSPQNNDGINKIMKFQQSEWQFFKKTFDLKEEKMSSASIFGCTNLIWKEFKETPAMCEKLVIAST